MRLDRSCCPPFFLVGLSLLLAPVGCEQPPAPAPPVVKPPPTPEERFERFLTALKRWVESDETRVAVAQADAGVDPGTPVTSWRARVEHRLLKPENPGDELRAEVAIRSKSKVSIVMPQPDEKEDDRKAKVAKREEQVSEDALDLPPELRSLQKGPTADGLDRLRSSPIVERKNERVSRYDLAYRDGEWVLLTQLDRENEPFNSEAIEYALKQQ